MLFYRAPLDRPAAALHVTVSPVRTAVLPSLTEAPVLPGRVRVVVRYGPRTGPVGVHRGWLHTDLPPARRLRLAGCQQDDGGLLLSLATVPTRAGRESLTDRFRLPLHMTTWGIEAISGVRVELFCIPSVLPGRLVLRGRAAVAVETPAERLVRAVPFCRGRAVALNPHLSWRARAAVEGLDLRVAPGGLVEGWLHVAVACWGEPEEAMGGAAAAPADPVAVRRVDAAIARVEAEAVRDGLALVSGAVELDVAWADRSGRGRWTCRAVPFSALVPLAGLCEGDQLEPVAQVEQLSRVGAGASARATLLLGIGLTALRPVHREIGGAWYRMAQVVGQAVATVQLDEPLFPREERSAPTEPWRRVRLDLGQHGPWKALRARIRRTCGRSSLEVQGEPFGAESGAATGVRLELPGGADAQVSLAAVGPQAELRVRRPARGGVEVPLPRGTGRGGWHLLAGPARWVVDASPCADGLRCLVRDAGGLRHVVLVAEREAGGEAAEDGHGQGAGGNLPAAWTVAGTAVRGLGMDRVWAEVEG
ncbi:hypothetical protein [Symbiobacterium thermophilum]|uniref:hypothetical protein n=2 Tax=Symbiobacterium thermophilum TaxID=2734 RepID=UPI000312961A|nr:hypothetical protein [Symbiobacterium thermophilum]